MIQLATELMEALAGGDLDSAVALACDRSTSDRGYFSAYAATGGGEVDLDRESSSIGQMLFDRSRVQFNVTWNEKPMQVNVDRTTETACIDSLGWD